MYGWYHFTQVFIMFELGHLTVSIIQLLAMGILVCTNVPFMARLFQMQIIMLGPTTWGYQ